MTDTVRSGESSRTERLQEAVYRISQAASQAGSLDDLFRSIHETIATVMPAGNFYIALHDEKNELLSFPYFVDEVDLPQPPAKLGRGLTEYVLRTGKSLLCDEGLEQELRARGEIEPIGAPSPIWLGVPLRMDGKTIGVMTVQHYTDENAYGERERQMLEFVSTQVAQAIEHKRSEASLARRAREMEALYDLMSDLTREPDPTSLPASIADCAARLLGGSRGGIYFYDPTRGDLEAIIPHGPGLAAGARLQLGEQLAGRAALAREPVISEDGGAGEPKDPAAVLAAPMLYGGELLGVVAVAGTEEGGSSQVRSSRGFDEQDARLLSLFAAQAAAALHNARLLAETRIRAEQLGLLYDAGLALNSVLEPRAQLEFLLQIAMRTLHADRAEYFRFDPVRKELVFELGAGYPENALAVLRGLRFPVGDDYGLQGRVYQGRVPLNLADLGSQPDYLAVDPTIRSGLWVPVEHQNQVLGTLGTLSTRAGAFSLQDERLMALFANQAAVALTNARLFEALKRVSS